MDETKPKWYRKKRWWVAGLLWLVGVYVFGYGPLQYAVGRGWVSPSVGEHLSMPGRVAARAAECEPAVTSYFRWWFVKGLEGKGFTVKVLPNGTIEASQEDPSP